MGDLLKCPVCDCEVPLSQQELLFAPADQPEPEIVVCHCPENHRFVVSSKAMKATSVR